MVVSCWLGGTLGCGGEQDGEHGFSELEPSESVEAERDGGSVVEVLDGVTVVVPPPGMRVAAEVIYDDGRMELVEVANDDGRVSVRYHDEQWGLVAPPPAVARCPDECLDDRHSLNAYHWSGVLAWRYNDAGRPAGHSRAAVVRALVHGAEGLPSARNVCGIADEVRAAQAYLGETVVAPTIGVAGGVISCSPSDGHNVVGWEDLPNNTLGYACTWSSAGEAFESDILLDNVHPWYTGDTAPPGCFDQFSLRGVVTHEFGHAFGLGHSPGNSCNLTMYPSIPPCIDDRNDLGLGDVLGLEAHY